MKEVAFIEDALVAIFRLNSLPFHRRLTFDVKDSKKEKEIFSYLCYQLFFSAWGCELSIKQIFLHY